MKDQTRKQKQLLAALIPLLFILIGFSSGTAIAEPQSYPIICKGGTGYMRAVIHSSSNENGSYISLSFKKSASSGSSGNVKPGECAWLDRPMSDQEPGNLKIAGSKPWRLCSIRIGTSDHKASGARFCSKNDHRVKEIHDLYSNIMSGNPLYFHGYTDQKNKQIVVTRIGP